MKPKIEDTVKITKDIINIYESRGLTVKQVNADNEFNCVREEIRSITVNIVASDEHVGQVERSIRNIKEGTRCHVHRLPFKRNTKLMITSCVSYTVHQHNNLPNNSSLNTKMCPSSLILGSPAPSYKDIMRLNFGEYVQVYNI